MTNYTDKGRVFTRVFIGGISQNVSADDINNEFGKYGQLKNVWVAKRPHGFAFVEYDNIQDAEEAVKSLNGVSLFNENKIRVEISKKKPGNRRGGGSSGFRGNSSSNRSSSFRGSNSNTSFKPKSRFNANSSSVVLEDVVHQEVVV